MHPDVATKILNKNTIKKIVTACCIDTLIAVPCLSTPQYLLNNEVAVVSCVVPLLILKVKKQVKKLMPGHY